MVYREICEGAVGEGGVHGGMGNLSCLCVEENGGAQAKPFIED
jgi:hypothetical protein